MQWEFEAMTLDEARSKNLVRLGKDGKYKQRYYNEPNKRGKRCIVAARNDVNPTWVGIATTYNHEQGDWLVKALELAGSQITMPFPTKK